MERMSKGRLFHTLGPVKCWMDKAKERISLPMAEVLTKASCWTNWKRISAESSLMFLLLPPPPDDLTRPGT